MAKITILESNNEYGYKVAIHFLTPAGNNSAGKSWKECALTSGGVGTTVLEVGTAPGNLSQAEYDSIIAGDTVEIVETINPGLDPSNATINTIADTLIAEWQASMARVLRYYGHTIGA